MYYYETCPASHHIVSNRNLKSAARTMGFEILMVEERRQMFRIEQMAPTVFAQAVGSVDKRMTGETKERRADASHIP
jgi:hypothetical protein